MNKQIKKNLLRQRKKKRSRFKVLGVSERPRLSVFRSSKHIYIQAVDDEKGHTLCSFSSLDKSFRNSDEKGTKTEIAAKIGKCFSESLRDKGISSAVFDRNGFFYHGRIKQLAESIRESGIQI